MSDLIGLLNIAVETKPTKGDTCNHCGYCCLTEVCAVGKELGGGEYGPCKLLRTDGDKHYCTLVEKSDAFIEIIGVSTGCCAETQSEVIARLTA